MGQTGIEDLAGMLPPEAFDPHAGTVGSRPASQKVLDNLKRIFILPKSAELFDAQVRLFEQQRIDDLLMPSCLPTQSSLVINAVSAQFMHKQRSNPTNANLHLSALVGCLPRTVKGGKLSTKTLSEISFLRQHRVPFICYAEQGDGVRFVQKALACQRAGETTVKTISKSDGTYSLNLTAGKSWIISAVDPASGQVGSATLTPNNTSNNAVTVTTA